MDDGATIVDESDGWYPAVAYRKINDVGFDHFMEVLMAKRFDDPAYIIPVIGCDLYTLKRGDVGLRALVRRRQEWDLLFWMCMGNKAVE